MPPIKIGNLEFKKGYIGGYEISKIYQGADIVWQAEAPGPAAEPGEFAILGTTVSGNSSTTDSTYYDFIVPLGVTSISMAAVGCGDRLDAAYNNSGSTFYSGGLSYSNNIAVTPGETLRIYPHDMSSSGVRVVRQSNNTVLIRVANRHGASGLGDVSYTANSLTTNGTSNNKSAPRPPRFNGTKETETGLHTDSNIAWSQGTLLKNIDYVTTNKGIGVQSNFTGSAGRIYGTYTTLQYYTPRNGGVRLLWPGDNPDYQFSSTFESSPLYDAPMESSMASVIDNVRFLNPQYVGLKSHGIKIVSDSARNITPKYNNTGVLLQSSISGFYYTTIANNTATVSSKEIYIRGRATGTKALYTSSAPTGGYTWGYSGTADNKMRIYGDLCTLLADAFGGDAPVSLGDNAFRSIFTNFTHLEKAPELSATTIGQYGYYLMFQDCASLVNAPELPATSVGNYGYFGMFIRCASLVKAPELPATTIGTQGYIYMFDGCTSLESIHLGYTGNDNIGDKFTGWVGGISTSGTLYKAGSQFSASGNNTYPATWTQVPWTP